MCATLDSIDVEVGMGLGIGGSATVGPHSATLVSRADIFCFEKKRAKIFILGQNMKI